jgi:hypothetical protein
MAKPFYSLEEVTTILKKTPDEISQLVRAGTLREFRDSGKVFFKAEDVEKLRGGSKAPPAKGPADSDVITLESVDDVGSPGLAGTDSLPSLSDPSGGTSIIGLADIEEEPAKPAKKPPVGSPIRPAAPSKPDTPPATPKLGVGVFDDDDLELDADPLAKTQVTSSPVAPAGDQMSLKEGTGSGSGLLDLTRESDDTSLGAELLDEIYPGDEEPAPQPAPPPAAPAARSGATAAAAAASARAAAAAAEEAADDALEAAEEAAEAAEEAVSPAAARGGEAVVVGPPRVAAGDPLEGLFGAMLVWGLVLLSVAGTLAAGVHQGFMPSFGAWLTENFWIFLAAAFGGLGLVSLIGWLIGRSGSAAPRGPKPPKAAKVKPAKPAKKGKPAKA